MKKTKLNGSADLLANAIRNSQKEVADEAVRKVADLMKDNNEKLMKRLMEDNKKLIEDNNKRLMEGNKRLMEDSKREILKANKEDNAKNFDRMGIGLRKELRKELKEDLHKYMGMYAQGHESRITKLEKKLAGK